VAAQSMMAPPDPAAGKLIDRARPKPRHRKPDAGRRARHRRTRPRRNHRSEVAAADEFGVDLGGANSVGGLRCGAAVEIEIECTADDAATHYRGEGSATAGALRLVAGPERRRACKICRADRNKQPCETAIFDGQRLAKADGTARCDQTWPRRRGAAKQSTVEEPAKRRSRPDRRRSSAKEFRIIL
jgi:hypothetical protein